MILRRTRYTLVAIAATATLSLIAAPLSSQAQAAFPPTLTAD